MLGLASIVVVIVAIFLDRRSTDTSRDVSTAPQQILQAPAAPFDAAVLTIVAMNRNGSPIKQGSGFILNSDGLAGSNYHVLKGASSAFAECCGGRAFAIGSVEGADLGKDLVVFQLYEGGSTKPHDLPHVTLASSKEIAVGGKVIAVGSPQGLENTVSDGILSAVREYDSVRYLQITAPISPGSSGGPVLNAAGEMVGIATFQFEKGQNLNFAVAAEHLRPLLDQHLQTSFPDFQASVGKSEPQQRSAASSKEAATTPVSEPPGTQPWTGLFNGTVHNQSASVSAGFAILVRDDDDVLSGCMGVKQPLFGSGPLDGFVTGDDVYFVVTSSIGKINFSGHKQNNAINGTYTVKRADSPDEEGTFTLKKTKSEGLKRNETAKCPTDAEMNAE